MGIGGVTSTNSMSSMQMLKAVSTDPKIKKIQNEITNAKQQMQKLSPKEELSDNEKETERKKLQKEISSLNTELKQHQEELRKSQKKEIRIAELQEDQKLTKEEKSEDKLQTKETSLEKADKKGLPTDKHQTASQGTVIASNSDGSSSTSAAAGAAPPCCGSVTRSADKRSIPQPTVPATSNIVTGRCLNTIPDAIPASLRTRMENLESTGQI